MPRLLAIGDIHGCATALRALVDFVRMGPNDRVITLGDYIDRGPDSKGVIEQLVALGRRTTLIPLRGNHELMMLRALESAEALREWIECGGDATFESYGVRTVGEFPAQHLEFIRSCVNFHEEDRCFFVHANVESNVPLDAQAESTLLWEHLNFEPGRHISGKEMICGHTPQLTGMPRNFGHAVCIDTNVHDNGWLTCLEVATGRYWQSNEAGERRADVLEPVVDDGL